jgi:hypothetical protein
MWRFMLLRWEQDSTSVGMGDMAHLLVWVACVGVNQDSILS